MPLYDCKCASGHKFEKLLKMDNIRNTLECPECGEEAYTIISPVRSKLDGCDPSLPGAYMQWETKRAKHMAQKKKQ